MHKMHLIQKERLFSYRRKYSYSENWNNFVVSISSKCVGDLLCQPYSGSRENLQNHVLQEQCIIIVVIKYRIFKRHKALYCIKEIKTVCILLTQFILNLILLSAVQDVAKQQQLLDHYQTITGMSGINILQNNISYFLLDHIL